MISLLSKIFIRDYENVSSPVVRQKYGMLCGAVGIGLNVILFIGKFIAGLLSGSVAITADAFNNLSDAGSSIIALIGFKLAGQKPDSQHPFGHGRIEYIAGLLISGAVILMAYELFRTSVHKLRNPEDVEFTPLIAGILVASILVKLYMSYYNKKLGKKLNSTVMNAAAADSTGDTLATALVLIATVIGHFTGFHIDGWCGILVSLFIFYAGFQSVKETLDPLLGQSPEKGFVEDIKRIVMESPYVLGVHDLIVHEYGPGRVIISLHAEVSAAGDIMAIHDEIDNIERRLENELSCMATIHMDPIVTDNEHVDYMKSEVKKLLNGIDSRITFHDFRMVEGKTHTNLIFDVAAPFELKMTDGEIISAVKDGVRKFDGNYFAVVYVDREAVV